MKKILWVLALIIGLVSLLIVSLSITGLSVEKTGDNKEITKIRIGNLPIVQGLPLYYAVEKGYFKEAGIDVEIVAFQSPNQIIDALMQGNLDFGSPSTALGIIGIANYKNPGKLKIYSVSGGDLDNPNEILFVSSESNITSIKELKGKKLGILGGSIQWRTIARYILAENGLEMDKDVIIVELAPGLQVEALASKQIDALLALEPIITIVKEKGIGKELIRAPVERTISNPFYGGAGAVSTEFAKENPKTTAKVIDIFNRAIKEINENPDNSRQYLKNYTSLNDDTISKVTLNIFKTCEDLTKNDINSIEKFYNIFTIYKVVDGNIDFNSSLICRVE